MIYSVGQVVGRGISVYEPWRDVVEFCNWTDQNLGPRPEGCTLDRINPEGNYEPGNLRWATQQEQIVNRRPRTAQYGGQ